MKAIKIVKQHKIFGYDVELVNLVARYTIINMQQNGIDAYNTLSLEYEVSINTFNITLDK